MGFESIIINKVVWQGNSDELTVDPELKARYLGI
jgi:hypothetical protein